MALNYFIYLSKCSLFFDRAAFELCLISVLHFWIVQFHCPCLNQNLKNLPYNQQSSNILVDPNKKRYSKPVDPLVT